MANNGDGNDEEKRRKVDELQRQNQQREIEEARRREAQYRAEQQLREQQLQNGSFGNKVVGRFTQRKEQKVDQKVNDYNNVHDQIHNYRDMQMGIENMSRIRDYAFDQHGMMQLHNEQVDTLYNLGQREAMTQVTLGGANATKRQFILTGEDGQQYVAPNTKDNWNAMRKGVDGAVDQLKYKQSTIDKNDDLMNQYNQQLMDVSTIMRHPDLDNMHEPEKIHQQLRLYQRQDIANDPSLAHPKNDNLQKQLSNYYQTSQHPGQAMKIVTDTFKYSVDMANDLQRGSHLDGAMNTVEGLNKVNAISDEETARIGHLEQDLHNGKPLKMQLGKQQYQVKMPYQNGDAKDKNGRREFDMPQEAFQDYIEHSEYYNNNNSDKKIEDTRLGQEKMSHDHAMDAEGNYDYYNGTGAFKGGSIHSSRGQNEKYEHWSADKYNKQNQRDNNVHQGLAHDFGDFYKSRFKSTADRKKYERRNDWIVDDALRAQTGTDRKGGNVFSDIGRAAHTYAFQDDDPAKQMTESFENGEYWKKSPAERTKQYKDVKKAHKAYNQQRESQRSDAHSAIDAKNGTNLDGLSTINGRKRGLSYLVDKNGNIVDEDAPFTDKLKAVFNEAIQDINKIHQLKHSWVEKKMYDLKNGHSAFDKRTRAIAGGITAAKVLGKHHKLHKQDEKDYQSAKNAILSGSFDKDGNYSNGAWNKIMKGRDFRSEDVRGVRNGTHMEGVNINHHNGHIYKSGISMKSNAKLGKNDGPSL